MESRRPAPSDLAVVAPACATTPRAAPLMGGTSASRSSRARAPARRALAFVVAVALAAAPTAASATTADLIAPSAHDVSRRLRTPPATTAAATAARRLDGDDDDAFEGDDAAVDSNAGVPTGSPVVLTRFPTVAPFPFPTLAPVPTGSPVVLTHFPTVVPFPFPTSSPSTMGPTVDTFAPSRKAYPTVAPFPHPSKYPTPLPTNPNPPHPTPMPTSTSRNPLYELTLASKVFMIPYALVWLVYGLFTLGYIACNEAYDDTYRCYNHFYAPMYCTRNQPYAEDHPNAVLGNGEGNYFRRCVGVVELLSACMILSTLHVNSNPDGYQGEATLAAIGVMTTLSITVYACLTHSLVGHAGVPYARHKPGWCKLAFMLIWGIVVLALRCVAVSYDPGAVVFLWLFATLITLVMIVLFIQYALFGYRDLENAEEALLKRGVDPDGANDAGDDTLTKFGTGVHRTFAKGWNDTWHA